MRYVVFKVGSGEIVRTGVCPLDQIENQAGPDEAVMADPDRQIRDTTHVVEILGGLPVATPIETPLNSE